MVAVTTRFELLIPANICIKPILVNNRIGIELRKKMSLEPKNARNR